MVRPVALLAVALAATASVSATAAAAQEGGTLALTLAGAEPQGGACRLSFLVENRMPVDLDALVLEAVMFSRAGMVDRLMLLDFQAVPQGRQRVRQFDLPGADCATLAQVLVNGAARCDGAGLEPAVCAAALETFSRVDGLEVMQ